MKQYEAVIEAMNANGGYATLGQLYQTVLKIPDCKWETKTPFASIRRIVQTHPDLFFKVKPGLWALESERKSVSKKFGIGNQLPAAKKTDYNHYFFQGLIVEIGNLRGYETFVPNQDKNKPYLRRRLADVASLGEYYPFTYESLLRRAKTIDVTWFNDRKLPRAFFEVEYSTDIYKSLIKFVEFQDFRTDFFIVADKARRSEFEDRLASSAFKPVRSDVKFIDYEAISVLHSKLTEDILSKELSRL